MYADTGWVSGSESSTGWCDGGLVVGGAGCWDTTLIVASSPCVDSGREKEACDCCDCVLTEDD